MDASIMPFDAYCEVSALERVCIEDVNKTADKSTRLLKYPAGKQVFGQLRSQTSSLRHGSRNMCRNIRTLFNFEPPVTREEVQAAALQFVRKITGFNKPSKVNEAAFQLAIEEITACSVKLLRGLETNAPRKNREEEAAKAKSRAAARFSD
jgi:hypothetical protein